MHGARQSIAGERAARNARGDLHGQLASLLRRFRSFADLRPRRLEAPRLHGASRTPSLERVSGRSSAQTATSQHRLCRSTWLTGERSWTREGIQSVER